MSSEDQENEFLERISRLNKTTKGIKEIIEQQNNRIKDINIPIHNSMFLTKNSYERLLAYSQNTMSYYKLYFYGGGVLFVVVFLFYFNK
ncbi:hypothetical protein A0H76_101 [Hepatospora eriocheir]|uniref:Uncharacterized protein n=1 Tax=Hepatospora eriocheir TaxID=1081669 RepID=A0A1X0QJE4_9MICR|nr:hypothetical protein A0H76_101 [Hepatospora eriocheir]